MRPELGDRSGGDDVRPGPQTSAIRTSAPHRRGRTKAADFGQNREQRFAGNSRAQPDGKHPVGRPGQRDEVANSSSAGGLPRRRRQGLCRIDFPHPDLSTFASTSSSQPIGQRMQVNRSSWAATSTSSSTSFVQAIF